MGGETIDRTIQTILQGEDLDFEFDRDGLTITGWVCSIAVYEKKGATAEFTRTVTATSGKWTGFLTSAETAALSQGRWTLVAHLSNAGTGEEEQKIKRFRVNTLWT